VGIRQGAPAPSALRSYLVFYFFNAYTLFYFIQESLPELKIVYDVLAAKDCSRLDTFVGYVRHTVLAGLPTQGEFADILGFFTTPRAEMYTHLGYMAVPYTWDCERTRAVETARKNMR